MLAVWPAEWSTTSTRFQFITINAADALSDLNCFVNFQCV